MPALSLPALFFQALLFVALMAALTAAPPAQAAEKSFELAVVRDSDAARFATPRVLRVDQGDAVRVRVVSDSSGEVHLHGYRLEARVAPGKIAELSFKATATGRFRIEWHTIGDARSSEHRHAPLAVLEVHPK